jgi:hypothetical protein
MTFMETVSVLGSIVGGVIFFVIVIAGILLFLRLIMEL